jgi:hypothetical protein
MMTSTKTLPDDEQALTYCRWADPQSRYVIELETGLADRLLADISNRQSELEEFGGLLIGEYVKAAKPTLRIDDIVWIIHQTSGNPRFELTPDERIQLSSTRRKLITPTRTVLGFFRTDARGGPFLLSAADLELLEREFRRAMHVVLLIRANHPPMAAFFMQDEHRRMQANPACAEFRFDSRELARFAMPAQAIHSVAAPHPAGNWVTSAPQRQTPQARSARITTPALIWRDLVAYRAILLPLVLSSIAICLLFTLWAPVTASVLVRNSQLRLSAIDNAGMVEIHWNTRLSGSERLKSATLVVEDGDLSREVRLSPAELRSGAAAYAPMGSHVRFTLVLSFPDSLTVTQSTDWVEKPSPVPHTATALDKA